MEMDKSKSEFEKIKAVNYAWPVRKGVIHFWVKIFLNVWYGFIFVIGKHVKNVMKCNVFIIDNRFISI